MVNKLINRLAQHAFQVAFTQTGVDSGVAFHATYNEKFAKLIVREYVDVVLTSHAGKVNPAFVVEPLKNHFGVK